MNKSKVQIKNDCGIYDVLVNGEHVASISGSRGEYWLLTTKKDFIARFKHGNALASAKHFATNVLATVAAEEAAANSKVEAPLIWAGKLGYVSYNQLKAQG